MHALDTKVPLLLSSGYRGTVAFGRRKHLVRRGLYRIAEQGVHTHALGTEVPLLLGVTPQHRQA